MEQIVTVEALKKLIAESSNEFKAVLGPNVESENKKNNGKAYSDAKKRAKDFDGGLSKEMGEDKTKYIKTDPNLTLLDYQPENVSDDYKKRVHAQVKGYTSVAEMENGLEKTGDFSNNDNIYKAIKKSGQEIHNNVEDFKKSGLRGSNLPEKTFKKEEMYESKEGLEMRNIIDSLKRNSYIPKPVLKETKNMKTVVFKKTVFLTENHMISRIPDEMKNDGEQFKMKDKNGSEYIVEWNNGKACVISHINKHKIDESFKKFHELSNYSSNDTFKTSTPKDRIHENTEINKVLNIIRNLEK